MLFLEISDDNIRVKINGNVEQFDDQTDRGASVGFRFCKIEEEILHNMTADQREEINDFMQSQGIPLRIQAITTGSLVVILKVLTSYNLQEDFNKHVFDVVVQIFHKVITSHLDNQRPVPLLQIKCALDQLLPGSDDEAKGNLKTALHTLLSS